MTNSSSDISVFLSYSRKDKAICEGLHTNLELQGLDVKIDINDIAIGDSIADSISQLIDNSSCSVVVVSENSLQSTWVIWEIQRRRQLGEFKNNSKLIAVYLDKTFLDDEFVKITHNQVQNHIEQLAKDALELSFKGTSSEHLDTKKQSLFNFKKNLSEVINYIRSINAVDLRIENYLSGFKTLYQSITDKFALENHNIITPPLFKNIDINSRIKEIESLVAEDNMKEAAKRTIDFIDDFYKNHIDCRKKAIKISARIHASEKNLSKGNELMAINDELADQILDLIYQSYPNAA